MRDEPKAYIKYQSSGSFRTHEGCGLFKTAGWWSWKSKSAKKCVKTYLYNALALKMDGAEANDLYSTISANAKR